MLNDKWVTVDSIIERVGRMFPDLEMDRQNAAEWCFDVVRAVGAFPSFEEKKGVVINVINNRVKLPCDTYRVLHVFPIGLNGGRTSGYRERWWTQNQGQFLDVASSSIHGVPSQVALDYLAFKVDEHDFPMVYIEAAEAAAFYIIMKMKMDDFLSGNMRGDRWQWLEQKYEIELAKAQSSAMRWSSREDLDDIVRVARSWIRPAHYAAK